MKNHHDLDPVQKKSQEQFARQSGKYGKGHILQNVENVTKALEYVSLPSRTTVLDVATGAGHTGLYLASLGHKVTLADLALPMLELARKTAEERGLKVQIRQHPAEVLPYPNESFDLVTCRVAPHHFSSPKKFVAETARVLRPGGSFLLIDGTVEDGNRAAADWMHQVEKLRDPSHHRFISPQTWRRMVRTAGLEVAHSSVSQYKQPDLNWYFETAATSPENRAKVLELIHSCPAEVGTFFRLNHEEGKIVWWWQILTMVSVKKCGKASEETTKK